MRSWSIVLLAALGPGSILGGLAGCASAPARRPVPPLAPEQQRELAAAEKLYRAGDPAFAAHRDRLAGDPATAYWLTRMLIWDVLRVQDRKLSTDESFLWTVAVGEHPLHEHAQQELRALGPAAVPALVEDLVRSPYSDRRQLGAVVLASMGPQIVPSIAPLMQDPDWRVRRLAVEVAVTMEPRPDVTALLERGAADAQFAVRASALAGLLRHGEAHLERGRRALANDPDPYVRRRLAEALAAFPDRATAETLVRYYGACIDRADRRGAEIAEASLQRISGHERSGDLSFWRAWLLSWPGREREGGQS